MKIDIEKNYTIEECLENSKWNNFTSKYPGMVTIAHNPSLKNIHEKTFGYRSLNLTIKKNGSIIGIAPVSFIKNKTVSVPHFSYGDLLFAGSSDEKKYVRQKLLNNDFEIRSFDPFSDYIDDSKIMCYLELREKEDLQWEYWKSKLRSQIRKGIKNGVEVKIGGLEYLDSFYKIYSRNMRDLGSPVLSFNFFKNILEDYKYGETKIFLAQWDVVNVATSLILTYKDFVEVCWASSLREYNRTNGNMVMYWEMIKYSVNKGYNYFSFGRSSKDSNTLKFKRQWSPEEKQLYFNHSKAIKINIKSLTFLSKIWSKLPLFFANWLGPYFAKRLY